MTLEEYQRLVAAGIIDKVEFLDGEVRMGEHGSRSRRRRFGLRPRSGST